MKFRGYRQFRGHDISYLFRYMAEEFNAALKDLFSGLRRINFQDNFEQFEVTVTMASGETANIKNSLGYPITKRIIIRQTGNGLITDGTGVWNSESVSLMNNGPDQVTVTVLFLR